MTRSSTYFPEDCDVPTGEDFTDGRMEGLPTQGACNGVRRPIRLDEAIMQGRRHRQLPAAGKADQPQ